MHAAMFAALMAASAALSEPLPLPPGVTAAWVVEGTARLRLEGAAAPDSHLTLLPEGAYFTAEGYKALTDTTLSLQRDLASVRATLKAYEAEALTPCPPAPALRQGGWSGRAVALALFAGFAVGIGGAVVLGAGK